MVTLDGILKALLVLAAALLAGCTVVPGIIVDYDADEQWAVAGGEEGPSDFQVIPISADLILRQAAARREAGRQADVVSPQGRIRGYEYRVGPQDVLNVVVWGHPDLSNPMGNFQNIEAMGRLVRDDGTIFFPYVGTVPVAGQTLEEIRQYLTERLKPYIANPQLDVRVVAFRSKKLYVTGYVNEPGVVPLTDVPITVMDAVNLAGGFQELADKRSAVLTRGGVSRQIDIQALYARGEGNLLLRDGDVLYIPNNEDNKVFVMGEVNKQKSVFMDHGELTLAEAISQADGFNLGTANTRGVFVIRPDYRAPTVGDADTDAIRPVIYQLDAHSATSLILADAFELQPRDVVYVSSSPIVRFNRVMAQILPSIQTLWLSERLIND